MATDPAQLSPDLPVAAPVSRAAAAGRGVTPHELRGPLWTRVSRDRHLWSATDLADPMTRIRIAASVLPRGAVIAGWAAAYLHGATDLDGRGPGGRGLRPVTVCLAEPQRLRRGPTLRPVRSKLAGGDRDERAGLPVTSVTRTWFDLARWNDEEDAVVALDAGLRAGVDLSELPSYLLDHRGWRGIATVRAALPLADHRARSCPESRLRYVWVTDAGLPPPEVNVEVFSESGRLLGLPDLLDVETGLVGEYDGEQHRALAAHTADNAREELFERHGLVVVRATSVDLFQRRGELVRRLRRAYREAERHPRPRSWRLHAAQTGRAL